MVHLGPRDLVCVQCADVFKLCVTSESFDLMMKGTRDGRRSLTRRIAPAG